MPLPSPGSSGTSINPTSITDCTGSKGLANQILSSTGTALRWVNGCQGTVTSISTGTGLTGGTITSTGTIALANTAVTPGSYTYAALTVDAQGRITAASSGATPICKSEVLAKGSVIVGTAAGAICSLPVGASGQVLTADAACGAGVAWTTIPTAGIPCSCLTAKGTLVTATAASIPSALAVGTDGQVLTANSACTNGLTWTTPSSAGIPCACLTAKGAIITATAASTPSALAVGTNGQVLTANSACTSGLTWTTLTQCTGTVTNVATGTGLTGGPITATGTIALANTAVTPGSYTYGSFTVDAQGRLTAASSGTAPVTAVTGTAPVSVTTGTAPVVSISAASTTASGAVQLYNNTDSTSTTLALTAAQGKNLQDQINNLSSSSNLTLAGTFNVATSTLASVTSAGTAAGFTVGSNLPSPASGNAEFFVIVTDNGTYTPPGGGGPYTVSQGDWLLSSGTSWQYLNVGPSYPYATTATAGIVCLATTALTQAGVDSTTAITPSAGSATYVAKSAYTTKGTVLVATAASTPSALAVGTNGQVLTADSTCASGVKWAAPAGGGGVTQIVAGSNITLSPTGGTGIVTISSTGGSTPEASPTIPGTLLGLTRLGGVNNTALGYGALICNGSGFNNTAIGRCSLALTMAAIGNVAIGDCSMWATTAASGNVAIGEASLCSNTTGSNNVTIGRYSLGDNCTGCYNTVIGTCAGRGLVQYNYNVAIGYNINLPPGNRQLAIGSNGICWLTGCCDNSIRPGAGIRDCNNSLGTAGQVLTSNGVNAVCWAAAPAASTIPCSCITGKGALITGTAAATVSSLSVGTDGQVLIACSACPAGIAWAAAGGTCAAPLTLGLVYGCSPGPYGLGTGNVTLGYAVGGCLTTGICNLIAGPNAGLFLSTACYNTILGANAGFSYTTACCTVFIGSSAGRCINGDRNVAIGTNAMGLTGGGCTVSSSSGNVAIGAGALFNPASTAKCNVAIGFATGGNYLPSGSAGSYNVYIGPMVTAPNPSGSCQLAIGFGNGLCWLTGCPNQSIRPATGIMDCAGSTGTAGQVLMSNGANAICWGTSGGSLATSTVAGTVYGCTPAVAGPSNLSLGYCALISATGSCNVAIGSLAGRNISTGVGNIAIGVCASASNQTGTGSVSIGLFASANATNTAGQTSVGYLSNYCSTGLYNTAIGFRSGSGSGPTFCSSSGSFNVLIGADAIPSSNSVSNEVSIRNGTVYARFQGSATAWTFVSDARDKRNIEDLPIGLEFITALQPRKFEWDHRHTDSDQGKPAAGFIAQEVLDVIEANDAHYTNLVDTNNPDQYTFAQANLVPILVNAVKELSSQVKELSAKNSELEARLEKLES